MEDKRKELFALIETNPEKAQGIIAFEILLTLDQIAHHLRGIRMSITGPLHREDHGEITTDIALTDQLTRIITLLKRDKRPIIEQITGRK